MQFISVKYMMFHSIIVQNIHFICLSPIGDNTSVIQFKKALNKHQNNLTYLRKINSFEDIY